jgi:hypothetical protein
MTADDATQKPTAQAMAGPSGVPNGTNKAKGGNAGTRPSTPAPANNQVKTVPLEDIYNATPKKDKGKGRSTEPSSQGEAVSGQAAISQNDSHSGDQPSTGQDTAAAAADQANGDVSTAVPGKKNKGKGKTSGGKSADSGSGSGHGHGQA